MTTITKGKTTATVVRDQRGDWAIAFGNFSATLPADGPEVEEWVAAEQPRSTGVVSDRIAKLTAQMITKPRTGNAEPWRGEHRTDSYVPLDGEEEVKLFPLRTRTWGPGAPTEVVAASINCTSPRCRERNANGSERAWRRLVVRFPGSDTLDPRRAPVPATGEVIEGREPAEVLAEHEAWHRENYPVHPRVALSNWITRQHNVPMPKLSAEQRAEFDRQLSIAKAERRGEVKS